MTEPEGGTRMQPVEEALRRRFEAAWLAGRPVPIEQCLPSTESPLYAATLEELVHIELEFSWKAWARRRAAPQGQADEASAEPAKIEDYLGRFPQLAEPETIRRLLRQEACVRRQCGDQAFLEEYRVRFPLLVPAGREGDALLRQSRDAQDVAAKETPHTVGDAPEAIHAGQFGNYELLDEIGRGGMGVVYRARQMAADRIVALKLVRFERLDALPGETRRVALDRFLHEAQAAAGLEHPNIVSVYEVGEHRGQPFYSMRLVQGRSLDEMVRGGPLAARQAAEYIEHVARAIDEAHRHGILHRDMKPANILVDARTEQAMVVDFGLAKVLAERQELTQRGEVMGTVPYMSPEQATDSSRVTPQSDVYGVGATLYHLLTGRPPFLAPTSLETLQQVLDAEPAPPRRVNPAVPGDIETICLKCLQKEPSRRYATAGALADDLRRFLDGKPILARPVGAVERTWLWCRRNPVVAILLGSTAAFLALALIASLVGYIQTSAALKTADRRFREQREAVDNFFTRVSENTLLDQPGLQPLRKELLADALKYYQGFLADQADDPTLRDELALAYYRVGSISEEIDSPAAALDQYATALRIQRDLAQEDPASAARQKALGDTLNAQGRALYLVHHIDESANAYAEAIRVRSDLVDAAPADHAFRRALANSEMNLGLVEKGRRQFDAARKHLLQAQSQRNEIVARAPDDMLAWNDLGIGYYSLGVLSLEEARPSDAKKPFEDAIASFEKPMRADPRQLRVQYRYALCHRLLADVELIQKDYTAAVQHYGSAMKTFASLALANPDVPEYTMSLAGLHVSLGRCRQRQQDLSAAQKSFQEAVAMLERAVARQPDAASPRRDLAVALREMAQCQLAAGDRPAARATLDASLRHGEELLRRFPNTSEYADVQEKTKSALSKVDSEKPAGAKPR